MCSCSKIAFKVECTFAESDAYDLFAAAARKCVQGEGFPPAAGTFSAFPKVKLT